MARKLREAFRHGAAVALVALVSGGAIAAADAGVASAAAQDGTYTLEYCWS